MIRVELRPSHRLRRLMISVLAALAAGMGVIALLAVRDVPWSAVRDLHATLSRSGEPTPARQEPSLEGASAPVDVPAMPRGTTACLRILRLGIQLSPPLRLTSLAADGSGGYHLEGSCRADQVDSLQGFLETLKGLPAKASLSYWQDPDPGESRYRFAFRGKLSGFGGMPLPPVTAAEGAQLLERVAERARDAGLRGVNADAVAEQPLGESLLRKRGKFWGSGSRSQITSFARAVGLPTQRQALVELLVVPGYPGENAEWESAQMFATVDVVVMAGKNRNGDF